MLNSAQAGSSLTLTIPRSNSLRQDGLGPCGGGGDAFRAVIIATLPGSGTLNCDSNGSPGEGRTAVIVGETIAAADILAAKLTPRGP